MSLVPSLLQAIVKADGEAMVMHAGDKPYVVSPTGQVELASRGLTLEAVNGIVGQLLPVEIQNALDEFGAIQYELPAAPEFPGEHFTVVSARGGDDVWVEIRRRRVADDRVPDEFFAPPPGGHPAAAAPPSPAPRAAAASEPVSAASPSLVTAALPPLPVITAVPTPVITAVPTAAAAASLPPVAVATSMELLAAASTAASPPAAGALQTPMAAAPAAYSAATDSDGDLDIPIDAIDEAAAVDDNLAVPDATQLWPTPEAVEPLPQAVAHGELPHAEVTEPVELAAQSHAAAELPPVLANAEPAQQVVAVVRIAPAAQEQPIEERLVAVTQVEPEHAVAEPVMDAQLAEPVATASVDGGAQQPAAAAEATHVISDATTEVTSDMTSDGEWDDEIDLDEEVETVAEAAAAGAMEYEAGGAINGDAAPSVEAVIEPALEASMPPPSIESVVAAMVEASGPAAAVPIASVLEPPPAGIDEPPLPITITVPPIAAVAPRPFVPVQVHRDVEPVAPSTPVHGAVISEPPAPPPPTPPVEDAVAATAEIAPPAPPHVAEPAAAIVATPPTAPPVGEHVATSVAPLLPRLVVPPPEVVTPVAPAASLVESAALPPIEPPIVNSMEPPPQSAVVLPMSRTPSRSDAAHPSIDPTLSGLERLLRVASARGASTLYVSSESRPSVRVDGELLALDGEPVHTARDVESLLLTLMPEESHEALRTGALTGWTCDIDRLGRVKCMSFRDHRGPGGVFQLMTARSVSADQLALPKYVQALAGEPEGLVLVAGPRASGKRTLVASLVDLMNRTRRDRIITIEREITIIHERGNSLVSQREIRGGDDELVAAARGAMREDPDVLVIEDLSTPALMNVALEAAATGHLVLGALAAHSATAAIDRIVGFYPTDQRRRIQFALSDSLRGLVVQVLLRKIGGGRLAVREVLLNTPAVSNLIVDGKTAQLPMALQSGRRYGIPSMNDTLIGLVQNGTVEPRHAYRQSTDRPGFLTALNRQGIDTSFAERLA